MPYEVTTNKSRLDVDLIHQYLIEIKVKNPYG